MTKKSIMPKVVLCVIILFGFTVVQFYFDVAFYFDPERIGIWLEKAGIFAPLVYMFVMAAAVVISPIPSMPLDLAAGAFFGPFLGTFYSLTGALCGSTVSFFIARFLGRSAIERLLGGHINFCMQCSDGILTRIVFISRLIPFVSFDVVSYGAGLTKMSLRKFIIATLFGMIPITFMYNYAGAIISVGRGISLAAGLFFVALFFVVPYLLERTQFATRIMEKFHDNKENTSTNT